MSAITRHLTPPASHLRPFDVRRDLNAVADLVQACFADTLDEDGQRYVEQMHTAARNPSYLRWAANVADHISMPLSGYVWEENGHLAGNLSLIPFTLLGQKRYLIANVAVDPDYRRKGIARALTKIALEHAHNRGASAVWLHVREENIPAFNLYQSFRFTERARRTTWESNHKSPHLASLGESWQSSGVRFIPPRSQHWLQQRAWLERMYPPELTWHFPFNLNALRPDLWGGIYRFLAAIDVRQWAAERERKLLGVLSWQAHPDHADHLWLASTPENEGLAIAALLPHARRQLAQRKRMVVDYPAGHGVKAFQDASFHLLQTLIWMEVKIKDQG